MLSWTPFILFLFSLDSNRIRFVYETLLLALRMRWSGWLSDKWDSRLLNLPICYIPLYSSLQTMEPGQTCLTIIGSSVAVPHLGTRAVTPRAGEWLVSAMLNTHCSVLGGVHERRLNLVCCTIKTVFYCWFMVKRDSSMCTMTPGLCKKRGMSTIVSF